MVVQNTVHLRTMAVSLGIGPIGHRVSDHNLPDSISPRQDYKLQRCHKGWPGAPGRNIPYLSLSAPSPKVLLRTKLAGFQGQGQDDLTLLSRNAATTNRNMLKESSYSEITCSDV